MTQNGLVSVGDAGLSRGAVRGELLKSSQTIDSLTISALNLCQINARLALQWETYVLRTGPPQSHRRRAGSDTRGNNPFGATMFQNIHIGGRGVAGNIVNPGEGRFDCASNRCVDVVAVVAATRGSCRIGRRGQTVAHRVNRVAPRCLSN